MRVQHREKKFVCSICSKTYSHETGLLKHLVTHPESHELRTRLWTCPVCDKVFTKESYLERHLEMKLDPEHNKALTDYKKRNGIRDVGRVNLAVHHTNGGVSNMVTSSDSGAISAGSSVELPSTSAQLMPASSSARTTDGMGSPPHTTTPSHTPSSFSHHSDLPPHPMPPRSPMVVHPTPSCSLAAADSTVPSLSVPALTPTLPDPLTAPQSPITSVESLLFRVLSQFWSPFVWTWHGPASLRHGRHDTRAPWPYESTATRVPSALVSGRTWGIQPTNKSALRGRDGREPRWEPPPATVQSSAVFAKGPGRPAR